ncbi:Neutral/alkaline non-lysosomal ceramidase-domain-containing protein [Mycena pura]|uniref:Neutral ceramidase n=1 Tax=Mycena pura TaxID=153505 RepID=A0AAD6XV77_9AGAR|nr:Neutral/alkaline non-lysosomal ceramidase-domain-containing protein [Mycena pura]
MRRRRAAVPRARARVLVRRVRLCEQRGDRPAPADAARAVLHGGATATARVLGRARSAHAYGDMTRYEFALANETRVRTCPARRAFVGCFVALCDWRPDRASVVQDTPSHVRRHPLFLIRDDDDGDHIFSDGPGAFDFVQGDNKTSQNPFWQLVKRFVTPAPPAEQIACHYPKPILLNVDFVHDPYEWSPSTVDVQILRVGNFGDGADPVSQSSWSYLVSAAAALPSARGPADWIFGLPRLEVLILIECDHGREAVRAELISSGILGEDVHVVVAGPANAYAHHIMTREECEVQCRKKPGQRIHVDKRL